MHLDVLRDRLCILPPLIHGGINSLAPGKFEWIFRHVIFKQILVIDGWVISCEFALIWMSLDFTDDQSTLVQVMAWCRRATNHYLSPCWPRSLPPYGVTRPQWVKYDITLQMFTSKYHFTDLLAKYQQIAEIARLRNISMTSHNTIALQQTPIPTTACEVLWYKHLRPKTFANTFAYQHISQWQPKLDIHNREAKGRRGYSHTGGCNRLHQC